MNETTKPEAGDSPFDEESIRILKSLPHRQGLLSGALPLLKLAAIPLVFIGGIGLFASLKQQQLMGLLLAVPILGVGGLLWFLAERAMFEKAPLGDLAMALFEGLGRGKVDKVRTIATSICLKTERAEANSLPMTFARAIAFDILAETSQDEGSAGEMAKEAVPLFRRTKDMGLNTPMLHFLMATSLRIAKFNEDAIAAYQTYLTMRPDDEGSRKIMTDLLGQTKNN